MAGVSGQNAFEHFIDGAGAVIDDLLGLHVNILPDVFVTSRGNQGELSARLQDLRAGIRRFHTLDDKMIPEESDMGFRFLEIVRSENGR